MLNIFNANELKDVLSEMVGEENRRRKQKSFAELDIYSGNQDKYIWYKIEKMYGKEALDCIQAITGINLATRIADAEASIYKESPVRSWTNASEKEIEQIQAHYDNMRIDERLMLANRLFRLGNQCQLMIVPKKGQLKSRVLYQHQYDVVPMEDDPETPMMYIIPLLANTSDRSNVYNLSDNINQKIADPNDKDLSDMRFVIWTKDHNFMCDGNGAIIDPLTNTAFSQLLEEDVLNPIGMLPIIDISRQKTMGFYATGGSELAEFSVTFGIILSDLAEIVKLQGYSQGVLSSLEEPKSLSIGPHRALWLKKDKNEPGDKDPNFQFVSPSPDLQGSMSYAENILRMFLSSRGTDSKLVSTQSSKDYSSGFERLLAMVDRSEATKGDKNLFYSVEQEKFEITKAWHNYLMDTQDGLNDELRITKLNDSMSEDVKFYEPMQIMTQEEKENSIQKRLELGLMTRNQAIQELYDVDQEKAQEMLDEINGDIIGQA